MKNTESHTLQSEYDTLSATLKQLTNQRDVAQKRLDNLDEQVASCRKQRTCLVLSVVVVVLVEKN